MCFLVQVRLEGQVTFHHYSAGAEWRRSGAPRTGAPESWCSNPALTQNGAQAVRRRPRRRVRAAGRRRPRPALSARGSRRCPTLQRHQVGSGPQSQVSLGVGAGCGLGGWLLARAPSPVAAHGGDRADMQRVTSHPADFRSGRPECRQPPGDRGARRCHRLGPADGGEPALLIGDPVRRGPVGAAVGRVLNLNFVALAPDAVGLVLAFVSVGRRASSVYVAVAVNAIVALGAMVAHRRGLRRARQQARASDLFTGGAARSARCCGFAAAGGFVALAFEIFFLRIMSYATGSGTIAFAP